MKLALMQPYLFPYLGYYQLVQAVDEFVFFDDVAFIKKGYINRNAILVAGAAQPFSVPVGGISQNRSILQHEYVGNFDPFLRQLAFAYSKAPHFDAVYGLVQAVLSHPDQCVARKNANSIGAVMQYLGVKCRFSAASELAIDDGIRSEARVIEVCRRKGASLYINAIGGRLLYQHDHFRRAGLSLRFLQPTLQPYKQGRSDFVPALSMVDVLMWCSPAQVVDMLANFELVA